MKEFYRKNEDQIEIIAIANDKKNAVSEYTIKNAIQWVVTVPGQDEIHEIITKLNVRGYPSFILIDKDGIIKTNDISFYQIENMFK